MVDGLLQGLASEHRFDISVITLALSSGDEQSLVLRRPNSWFRRVRNVPTRYAGVACHRVGAFAADFEFQRYRPRKVLTQLLSEFDILQFVVGSPQWAVCAAKVARPKLIWTATTVRDDRRNQMRSAPRLRQLWMRLMTAIVERYERRALAMADGVFALSNYTLSKVKPLVGAGFTRLAISGIDTDLFCPAAHNSEHYLVCVGRLDDPRKNIPLLVRAYHSLRQQLPSAPPLWLVGPSSDHGVRAQIERLGLGDCIHLHGPVPHGQLPAIYQNAMAFVLSSEEEGLGIVLQEAMACGLPVVSTACGGPETIIEHGRNGLLVPVGDADALAGAMRRLVEDADGRRRMSLAALERARSEFTIEAATRPFLEAYDRILAPEL